MLLERYRIPASPWVVKVSHYIEWFIVLSSITSLRAIAPLSILYLAISFYYLYPLWHWALLIPTIPEAFFYLFLYLPRREILQRPPSDVPSPLTKEEREILFSRVIKNMSPYQNQYQYPAGWFIPTSTSSPPHRENIIEWLLFILFSTPLPSPSDPPISPEWQTELDVYLRRLELARGEAFPEGRSKEAKLMRLSFDRVPMCHRPILWYFVVAILDHSCALDMWWMGFKHWCPSGVGRVFPPRFFTVLSKKSVGGQLSYWYRPPPSSSSSSMGDGVNQAQEDPKPTLIVFHGIGTGIFPYLPFVQDVIKQHPNQGILFIEILQISTRITNPICSRHELFNALCSIIDDLHLERLNLVANSYGTLIGAMIIREQNRIFQNIAKQVVEGTVVPALGEGEGEDLLVEGDQQNSFAPPPPPPPPTIQFQQLMNIKNFILVDMVAFCLHLPDLPHNFVYRQPRHAYEWVIWYFSGRDADVIRTLGRHFFWQDYILWKEDIPPPILPPGLTTPTTITRHVAIVLGGLDCILPTVAIKRYLTGRDDGGDDDNTLDCWVSEDNSGLEVIYMPEEDHATVFAKGHRDILLDVVERYNGY